MLGLEPRKRPRSAPMNGSGRSGYLVGRMSSVRVSPVSLLIAAAVVITLCLETGASPAYAGARTIAAAGDIACPGHPCPPQRKTARLVRRLDPKAVLALGDNQYESGGLQDFRRSYRPTWGRFRARTHPVPGNHDYSQGYFRFFGRKAHGPRGYYTYRIGRWRLFALNSENRSHQQTRWLRRELRRDNHRCELAYWHEPRWSSGTYHGGTSAVAGWWRILYRQGVDVVLNGHEHNYERFARLTAGGRRSARGIREFVVGTGGNGIYQFGRARRGSQRRVTSYGVLSMRLRARAYHWEFRKTGGGIADSGSEQCHR
jgi:Calcineurin-like phosphoesterase